MSVRLWNLNFIDQCIQKGLLAAFIATYMFFEENGTTLKDIQENMENHLLILSKTV